MGLLQLPSEILISILLNSKLDVRDAFAVQLVNHYFHDLYKTSIHLQYDLECKVAQVMDNPHCTLPVGQRLQMLRDQEAAWRSLVPAFTRSVSGPKLDRCWRYQMENNHLLCLGVHQWANPIDTDVKSLSIQDLGELEEDHFHLNHWADEADLLCTCIAEHDLFATLHWTKNPDCQYLFFELRVHLLEHSTGKAHPRAIKPVITLYRVPEGVEFDDNASRALAMEVFGENLVVSNKTISRETGEGTASLYIYNWETGEAKCEPIPLSNTGIIALDHDLILIPDNEAWSLLIYHIPPSSAGEPVKLIKRLGLPPLSSARPDPYWTECRCAPNPTGGGRFPKHVSPSLPFITRPESAIAIFKWIIGGYPTEMIVHRDSLVNLLPSRDEWSTMIDLPTIHWDTWGCPNALWRNCRYGIGLPSATNGQRIVDTPIMNLNTNTTLEDFNKYNVRRSQEKERNHFIFENEIFLHSIISRLPFLEITSPVISNYNKVVIGDGLIVGIKHKYYYEVINSSVGTSQYDIFYLCR